MALTQEGKKFWDGEAPELTLLPSPQKQALSTQMSEYGHLLWAELATKRSVPAYVIHQKYLLLLRRYFKLYNKAVTAKERRDLHEAFRIGYELIEQEEMRIDPPLIQKSSLSESSVPMVLGLPIDPSLVSEEEGE